MRLGWLCTTLVLLTASLAGCIGADEAPTRDATDEEVEATGARTASTPAAIGLEGSDCLQGGGQSVHPRSIGAGAYDFTQIVPEPWRVADVLEDTGPQYTYSQYPKPTAPVPEEGGTFGHYHATVVCETWTLDGEQLEDAFVGFVGLKVQSPSFAETSADDEYLTTVVATNHAGIHERLARGGIDVMHANRTIREPVDGAFAISMVTDHNGEYLSSYSLNELGPIEDTHVRLWFQHENPNGTYAPIAIDMVNEGGTHYGDQGEGYFHHQATAHHWPLPGAYGHAAAVHYDGFDRSFEWGPRPNATLDVAYEH